MVAGLYFPAQISTNHSLYTKYNRLTQIGKSASRTLITFGLLIDTCEYPTLTAQSPRLHNKADVRQTTTLHIESAFTKMTYCDHFNSMKSV